MNDPIKDFIEKNREQFDHLEAPAFDLNKFKARATATTPNERRVFKLVSSMKWLAAASVVMALGTFLYFNNNSQSDVSTSSTIQNAKLKPEEAPREKKSEHPPVLSLFSKEVRVSNAIKPKTYKAAAPKSIKRNTENVFEDLADSSSSSVRLAAILAIKKQGTLSNYVVKRLASSLNQDNNSNVRLAALSILGSYSKDEYVSSILVSSLSTQTDPMVQLELVTLLGNMEHLKIDEKLYALAADPGTFGAVKDEAYSILLNQNKL